MDLIEKKLISEWLLIFFVFFFLLTKHKSRLERTDVNSTMNTVFRSAQNVLLIIFHSQRLIYIRGKVFNKSIFSESRDFKVYMVAAYGGLSQAAL